jgi:hypothetical protein
MNTSWKNTADGRWDRQDGATVVLVSPFNFEATGPDGVKLKTRTGRVRTWTRAENAADKVDEEWPLEAEDTTLTPLSPQQLEQATGFPSAWAADSGDNTEEDTSSAKADAALVTDAATAVRQAVVDHTGRVRPVKAWKPVAAKVLGLSKLFASRWDAVLERGIELGLFAIDDSSFSYPVLTALDPQPEPEPEPEAETSPKPAPAPRRFTPPPEDWEPPSFMDCGHLDCCLIDGTCTDCEKGRPPSWRHLRGEFIRPIPTGLRRTRAKEAMGGFPGLCCDTDGLYIGGTFNDCRRTGDARCEVHA